METDSTNLKIDTHVHIMPEYRIRSLVRWMKKAFPGYETSEHAAPEDLVEDLRKGGLTHFFNLVYPLREDETIPLNDFNAEFCKNTPGAIPFASMHQDTPDKAAVAESAITQTDVAGFKLHPFVQKFDPWDSRMDPFYAFLQEAGKPVLFHTGFEAFYKKSMPVSELRRLLKRFPRLPAVFVHMAFPELDTVFRMMEEFPDLYLDATGVFVFLRHSFQPYLPPHLSNGKLVGLLEENLETFNGRILFGSDHPVGWGDIGKVFNDLSFLPVSDATRATIRSDAAVSFVNRFLPGFDWSRNLQDQGGDE